MLFIDTIVTIHMEVLILGLYDEQVYNVNPCIIPSCQHIISTHENYHYFLVKWLNSMIIPSPLLVLLVKVMSGLRKFL